MKFCEKTLNSRTLYKGKIINLRVDEVLLPDNNKGYREVVEHPGGVAIVAINGEDIVLVSQFRKPLEETILEIPAGKLNAGEDPYFCAMRELQEETGYSADDLKLLTFIYTAPGFSDEKLYIYFTDSLKEGSVNRDDDEFMDVHFVKFHQVCKMILEGKIRDAKTICGVLMLAQGMKKT